MSTIPHYFPTLNAPHRTTKNDSTPPKPTTIIHSLRQTRLESHFYSFPAASRSRKLTFLDLPFTARRLVYAYAGIINRDIIDLNWRGLRVYHRPEEGFQGWNHDFERVVCQGEVSAVCRGFIPEEPGPVWTFLPEEMARDLDVFHPFWERCELCERITFGLLLVCRAVSKEVVEMLYTENTFYVSQRGPDGLGRLRDMSPNALRAMKYLTVNLSSYESRGFDFRKFWVEEGYWTWCNAANHHARLSEWEGIIEKMTKSMKPGRLSLSIIMEPVNLNIAREWLHNLTRLLPLSACGLQLQTISPGWDDCKCYLRNPTLSAEIESLFKPTIQKLIVPPPPTRPFRFLDLPKEIRLQILEYTDLATPKTIHWQAPPPVLPPPPRSRRICFVNYDHDDCIERYGPEILLEIGDCMCPGPESLRRDFPTYHCNPVDRKPVCCGTCAVGAMTGSWDRADGSEVGWYFCLCHTRTYAVENYAYSSTCTCSSGLHPLLHVSHQVRADALPIHYSTHRFMISPSDPRYLERVATLSIPQPGYRLPKAEISTYLSSIPNLLHQIRRLEWIVPTLNPNANYRYLIDWYDYLDTIALMSSAMNLSRLTLVVYITDVAPADICFYGWELSRGLWGKLVRQAEVIVGPFTRLEGLKDFWVFLARPFQDVVQGETERVEAGLERTVMGGSYDSRGRGKPVLKDERYV